MIKDKIINNTLGFTKAKIRYNTYREHTVKTLLIDFAQKRRVLSTREGFKDVRFLANHYSPRPLWDYLHTHQTEYDGWVHQELRVSPSDIALLYTGADMDNVAIISESHQDLTICCLVTAGARGNAQRAGIDIVGAPRTGYRESNNPGTVNIILLCSHTLTDGVMARTIIGITEAKAAVFQDMEIKSTYTPANQATGTGTDNIIISGGDGAKLDSGGGHTKLGELINRTTRKAVMEALAKQDKIDLSVFPVLKETK
jgi:adenosylcobinamide hydrolase